jgi:hypothetical protein
MATKNEWLTTNITERLTNHIVDFKATYSKHQNNFNDFTTESQNVKWDILNNYPKLFVPLSGGMDSEYVFEQFYKEGVTPIIVSTPGNKEESAYAFKCCEKYGAKPVIIEKTEKEILTTFCSDIFLKLNGVGYNSTPALIAARYAQDKNGVAIIGEHGYNDINEWDFYNDAILGKDASIYYFLHTPQMVIAMKKEYAYHNTDHQSFKAKIYGIENREKMIYQYSEKFYNIVNSLIRTKKRPNVRDIIQCEI